MYCSSKFMHLAFMISWNCLCQQNFFPLVEPWIHFVLKFRFYNTLISVFLRLNFLLVSKILVPVNCSQVLNCCCYVLRFWFHHRDSWTFCTLCPLVLFQKFSNDYPTKLDIAVYFYVAECRTPLNSAFDNSILATEFFQQQFFISDWNEMFSQY